MLKPYHWVCGLLAKYFCWLASIPFASLLLDCCTIFSLHWFAKHLQRLYFHSLSCCGHTAFTTMAPSEAFALLLTSLPACNLIPLCPLACIDGVFSCKLLMLSLYYSLAFSRYFFLEVLPHSSCLTFPDIVKKQTNCQPRTFHK